MKEPVVFITGAAGVLGRAVADAFATSGARRVLVDLKAPPARADDLALAVDLADAAAVGAAVDQAVRKFGRIDALCNIAGGFRMGPKVHETPPELWRQMLAINAETLLNVVRAVVPKMLAQGGGRIVNVGAMGGTSGRAEMGAYSVSKSAVIRLTEAMSAELREQGINVNCVLPSILDTPPNRADMPKADPGKWVAPADLASVIVFLCSDGARAIHGAAIPVVGLS